MTKVIGATEEADMYIRKLAKSLGYFVIRLSDFGKKNAPLDLAGDRYLEWAWMVAHLPDNPGDVMDFGCGDAFLGLTAAIRGGNVVGFDRKPPRVPYFMDNLTMQAGDILDFDFKEVQFDIIMNCSSIEHVGLPGRYDSTNVPNGDLVGMDRLRKLLRPPDGTILLTVPVGQDAVFSPFHRVYGVRRLDLLLKGFHVIQQEFWTKRPDRNEWISVGKKEALTTQASSSFYALGFFILKSDVSPV